MTKTTVTTVTINMSVDITVSGRTMFFHEEYGNVGPYSVVTDVPSKIPVITAPDGKEYAIALPKIIENVVALIESGAFSDLATAVSAEAQPWPQPQK